MSQTNQKRILKLEHCLKLVEIFHNLMTVVPLTALGDIENSNDVTFATKTVSTESTFC